MSDFARHYLEATLVLLRGQKRLAERAFAQLEPADFHLTIDAEANSIAVLIKHMWGNMRSRWGAFLESDGEKLDRHRDAEFVDDIEALEPLMELWEEGWGYVFTALEMLSPEDLLSTVTIRGKPHTVLEAIQRQVSHYAYHLGQIVMLAKHIRGESWRTLSIPRGRSQAFNESLGYRREENG